MIKALLFDVDGTLIDSLDDLVVANTKLMTNLNLTPLSREEVSRFIGKGARVLVIRALNARLMRAPTDGEIDHALGIYLRAMAEVDGQYSKLAPYVPEGLVRLKKLGFPMAVVTNKPHAIAEALLEKFQIRSFFDAVIGADDVEHPKPAPDMLFLAASRVGADINESAMIGDSMNDALAAQNAKAHPLLLRTGFNEGIRIDDWVKIHLPLTPIFDTMKELSDYLENVQRG